MTKQFLKDAFVWGFVLWLIGYILGFLLFFLVPQPFLGWFIMPIGLLITYLVLKKKIKSTGLGYYLKLGIAWTLIAVILDYLFLVKLLKPADGYYKPDVYLYYGLTLVFPVIVGWWKNKKS